MTLRFLASGESLFSLSLQFRLGVSTACSIVKHTCNALYESHAADYLSPPRTAADWEVIANEFYEKWNFPLCLGALDGKHIRIKCPPKAGSSYYNYKNFHSIVLLALVNAHYQFTVIDVGASGREGDSAIFRTSSLANGMDDGSLRLPNPTTLPNSNQILPYAIVGDEAFPLTPNIMRPYPGRKNGNLPLIKQIFNYRLITLFLMTLDELLRIHATYIGFQDLAGWLRTHSVLWRTSGGFFTRKLMPDPNLLISTQKCAVCYTTILYTHKFRTTTILWRWKKTIR